MQVKRGLVTGTLSFFVKALKLNVSLVPIFPCFVSLNDNVMLNQQIDICTMKTEGAADKIHTFLNRQCQRAQLLNKLFIVLIIIASNGLINLTKQCVL